MDGLDGHVRFFLPFRALRALRERRRLGAIVENKKLVECNKRRLPQNKTNAFVDN